MTLPMDIRIASTAAKAGFVFARRAIVPEATSTFFLPRIVGISKALAWCYSGKLIPAQEMYNGGLISEVTTPESLLSRAYEIAKEIADNTAPVSIALTRQMLWRGLEMQHPMEAHQIDSRAVAHRGRSGDAAEGIESFLEKRRAEFKNKVSTDMPDFYPWWDEPKYQ